MKRLVFAAALLLLFVAASLAQTDKYRIITEKKGPLGIGGKTVMMLDRETGDTWLYQDNKWVLIPKVEEEVVIKEDASTVKAKMEEELNSIRAKQDEELNALKAKYDVKIKSLDEEKVVTKSTPVRQTYRKMKPRRRLLVKKAAPRPVSQKVEEGGEDGPPAWLSD